MRRCLTCSGFITSAWWMFCCGELRAAVVPGSLVDQDLAAGSIGVVLLLLAGVFFAFVPLIFLATISHRIGRTNELLEHIIRHGLQHTGPAPVAAQQAPAAAESEPAAPSFRTF
jgi:hypothetical protein